MEKYWDYLQKLAPKWVLYALESFILFLAATILFPTLFNNDFDIPIYFIWLISFIFSLNFSINRKNKKIFFYFLIGLFLLLGILLYEVSYIAWIFSLGYIVWRFLKMEEIVVIDNDSFVNRIFTYMVISIIFFFTNLHWDYLITNIQVVYSYIIIISLFLLGSFLLQLNGSRWDKDFKANMFLQTLYGLIGIGAIIALYIVLRDSVLNVILLIRKYIAAIFLLIGKIIEYLLVELKIDENKRKEVIDKLKGNNKNDEENAEVIVDYGYDEQFWYYAKIIFIVIVTILIVYFTYKLVNKIKITPTSYNQTIESIKGRKRKGKKFISNNFYRKNYQKYVIWLNKIGLDIKEYMSSTDINNKVLDKNSTLSNEAKQITNAYQQVRYGNLEPEISHGEYKEMLKKLKTELKK